VLDGHDYLPLYGGEAVSHSGRVISRVRSAGYGFTVERNIALAYLPTELAVRGSQFKIQIFDSQVPAQVERNVLVDPKGERLRT
jgi:glycine cleavage system aminomethyltransferase T